MVAAIIMCGTSCLHIDLMLDYCYVSNKDLTYMVINRKFRCKVDLLIKTGISRMVQCLF